MRSLVLVGHGSHFNPESARSVYNYAELIREKGIFSEVIEGYWKEEPSLRQVLRCTRYTDVTIIPMFISEGYFTETVLPRELNLGHQGSIPAKGITRQLGAKTVRYTLPYGVHPKMSEVILARAEEIYPSFNPIDTALVVIGHGTTRNSNSRKVIDDNVAVLQKLGLFHEVHALFLDQEPKLTSWQDLKQPHIVMVPFFTAEGWHTEETIPEELGLTGKVTEFNGQTVHYASPVGTHPLIADVILQIAEEARHNTSDSGELDLQNEKAWQAFLSCAAQGMLLGEMVIKEQAGIFELRHMLDSAREDLELLITPESLRDVVRLADSEEFRVVHTFRNLPRGWRAVFNAADLRRAVHYVYPAAIEETYLYDHENLRYIPWMTTARRQTGIYNKVQKATLAEITETAKKVCGQCLKSRLWMSEPLHKTFLEGTAGGIPCAEACSYFISRVRDKMS